MGDHPAERLESRGPLDHAVVEDIKAGALVAAGGLVEDDSQAAYADAREAAGRRVGQEPVRTLAVVGHRLR